MSAVKIKDVVNYLEQLAPKWYQEDYDNSGLLLGNQDTPVSGILVSLDCIENVVDEAIREKCNLIVAHHPIIFKGLRKLTGSTYIERTVIKAIKADVAIYAIHTNLDHVMSGVNKKIGERLGARNIRILKPKIGTLLKLVSFVPPESKDAVLAALYRAGAGQIGDYKDCSFQITGEGTFTPGEQSNPYLGKPLVAERATEVRLEVILPIDKKTNILHALRTAHPYEEVAFYLSMLENENQEVGAGMIGDLPQALAPQEFLNRLKQIMQTACIRYTTPTSSLVKRVAWCGGAGSFLLAAAKAGGADVFVSADFKYHEFFDADGAIMIADIGHYESEQFTKELLMEVLKEKFTTFAIIFSKSVTNPISYL